MKIFKDPKDAVGYNIQYYTWEKPYFKLERVDMFKNKVYGIYVNKDGKEVRTSYNLCKGITKGEKFNDYWSCMNYNTFKLDDELFEI
jgi:hypothetical protein